MSSRVYWTALVAIVAVELALTWVWPSADAPLHYSRDVSLTVDGPWYLAEARSWVDDRIAGVVDAYRQRLYSAPAALAYRFLGISIASSRFVSSLGAVATLFLLAHLLRRRYGETWALFGVGLLALHPAYHAFVRSSVVYPWVGFWLLAILALAARRGVVWRVLALALLLVVAVELKTIVAVALPAIALESFLRWRATRESAGGLVPLVGLGLVAAAVASVFAFDIVSLSRLWNRVVEYVAITDENLLDRVLSFEERSRLVASAPVLLLGAILAVVVLTLFAFPSRASGRRLERSLVVTVVLTLAVFALSRYTPLRYLTILFPLLAYLSASAAHAVVEWSRRRRLRGGVWRLALGTAALVLGGGLWLAGAFEAIQHREVPGTALAIAGALGAVAVVLFAVRRPRAAAKIALAFAIFAISVSPRWLTMFAERDYSILRANREVVAALPRDASLVGPFAHALTLENDLQATHVVSLRFGDGQIRHAVESNGWTHLVTERPEDSEILAIFENEGVAAEHVAEVHLRGSPVHIYRLKTSPLQPSDYERAAVALREGRFDVAARLARSALERHPESALASTVLGEALQGLEQPDAAVRAFRDAVWMNPGLLRPRLKLVEHCARRGWFAEAWDHATAALGIDTADEKLRARLHEIRQRLAQEYQRHTPGGLPQAHAQK